MKEAGAILKHIESAQNIVITTHRAPDGDAVGSSMAMYYILKTLRKNSTVIFPDPPAAFLDWIIKDVDVLTYEEKPDEVVEAMNKADLIFCLDYSGPDRMGEHMGEVLGKCEGFKIMIDHHPNPHDFADIPVSMTRVGSTCELVYEFMDSAGIIGKLNQDIAEAIYLGIMTDTGSFRFSSVSARTHEILSNLHKTGIDHTAIHTNTFDNITLKSLRLRGYATSEKLEVIPHYHIAYISLTAEELERFHYQKGDTEGLVNIALAVENVMVAAFFSEKDGEIKISFRSKEDIAVNTFAAEVFDGGGHRNAAGGFSRLSMDETIKKFKENIPKYFSELSV